jgi:hypothetical protein
MKYSLFKRLSNQAAASVPSGFSGDDWHREYDKKFAELIVRECIMALYEDDGATHHEELLKQHFGVDQ